MAKPKRKKVGTAVETDILRGAQRLLESIADEPTENQLLLRLRRLLAPPTVRLMPVVDKDRTQEFQWVEQHASEYHHCWLAVEGDELLVAAPNLNAPRQELDKRHPGADPLAHWVS